MENVALNARKKLSMEKYVSQVRIVTPNTIVKLIDVSARSVISSTEIVNNFLLVSGKLFVNAVYIAEDNKIENTETSVDFVEKQKVNFVLTDIFGQDEVKIEDVSVSSSEIACVVEHNTTIYGIYKNLLGDASSVENDIVINKKQIECFNLVSTNEDNFVVAEEVESNLKEIKVLDTTSSVVVGSVIASVDKVIIDGKVKVQTLYLDDLGLGELTKEFEFKQEIATKNTMPGMSAEAMVRVVNVSVTEQPKEDKNSIAFVIDFCAKVYTFESKMVDTFDDVFSLSREISPVYDYVNFEMDDGVEFETDTVLTQTDISVNGDFDDLIGVIQPKINVEQIDDVGEKVVTYATIKAVAIYKTTDGISKLDLKYETRFEAEKDINKSVKNVVASVIVSAFKVKAGKDLETTFFVDYKYEFEKRSTEKYVKSYEIGQEKSGADSAIKVYVTKGEQTLFDVAKTLNVRPEIIADQNEVSDVFEAGQKVYVYSPLNFC